MRKLLLFISTLLFTTSLFAAQLRIRVIDTLGRPVAGAHVAVDGGEALRLRDDGLFARDVADGAHDVAVSADGFRSATATLRTSDATQDVVLQVQLAESIVVSGIRASETTPVTKTDIERTDIERDYHNQDVPLLMTEAPAINAYTESGVGGSGYSYISLRGVGPTRINFTLDGVPLADSEDMATYFADFPDLARSLQSIQIQRGVGTSTVGSASFGGSVNLQSIDIGQAQSGDVEVSGGSFGSRLATIGYHSGALPGGLAFYTRVSSNESDGFREHSGVQQRNVFFSAVKQLGEWQQLRLTGFSGHEKQQMSFYATDADTLKSDLRFNPLQPEERDSFGYDLAQLQYLRTVDPNSNFTASVYYQRGYGWYRLFDDPEAKSGLREYGLDGMLVGSLVTFDTTIGRNVVNMGVHVNRFEREHTRDLVDGPRDYFNYGVKTEGNAFVKVTRDVANRLRLYGDAQLRYSKFRYHGDVKIAPIEWTFFNPKLGARYTLSDRDSLYASFGVSTREPARNDLFLGEDNPTIPHDLHAVKPERLYDLEAGWNRHAGALDVAANVYAMEFRHEIASTGELSDIGLLLRRNVDRSYRRGIEFDATWQARPALRLRTTANLSRNRIHTWTQFFDVYDADGNFVDSKPVTYHDVEPLLTPKAIVNQSIDWSPLSRLTLGATGRWVSRSYLDNTNDPSMTAPSFFNADANVSVQLARSLRLNVQVNNVFNNDRIYPSGYDYVYLTRDATGAEASTGIPYYYPQATRNVVVSLKAGF